jgi:hypothetical protein
MDQQSKFFHPKTEPVERGDAQTLTAGPYPFRALVDIHGYHVGGDGGDSSSAFLELYVDGVLAARREDHHFNTYNLTIDWRIWLERHSSVTVSVKGGNDKATTWKLGVNGWVTPVG